MATPHEFHVEPKLIHGAVESHPGMLELQESVRKRYRTSKAEARNFAEELLTESVERLGTRYIDAMADHIDTLFKLREQAARVIDRVIGPEAWSPEEAGTHLEKVFADIQSEMEAITDPETFAKKAAIEPAERSYEGVPRVGRHNERTDLLKQHLGELPPGKRAAVRKAANFAPRELWRAVSSETESGLETNITALKARARAEGLSQTQVDALEGAVRDMQEYRNKKVQRNATGTAAMAMRSESARTLVARLEKAMGNDPRFAEGSPLGSVPKAELRRQFAQLAELVDGSRPLELLAQENPTQLFEQFMDSGATTKGRLQEYIRHQSVTQIRGMLGEFTAAFQLGDSGLVFLKGPDYNVTLRGTDLVAVTRDGRIWLIDNKALSASELESVTSLTRNLAENVQKDAEAFSTDDAISRSRKSGVRDAVDRLDEVRQKIKEMTKDMSEEQIKSKEVQKKIADLCASKKIDLVVTNAGGHVEGLSEGLRKARIRLEDLNGKRTKNPARP